MTDLAAVGTGPVTRPPPLPVGVVGAGRFATFLTEAVHDLPDIRFTAVADADPDRARRLAATLIARQLVDWRALIAADDADAVVIATPPATHAEITATAARRSAREERTIHLKHRAAGRAASPAPARTSPPPSRRRSPL